MTRNDGNRRAALQGSRQEAAAGYANGKLNGMGYNGEVAVLRAHERAMRDNGIALDIDVLGLSKLKTSVDWYLDLGVKTEDTRRRRISPGRKALVNDGRLESLQTQIRNRLYQYSHVVTALGSYRYMTDEAFEEWYPIYQEQVAAFEQVKDEIIADYDQHVASLEEDYREMARETYEALAGREDGRQFRATYSMSEFQNAVVWQARSKLPTRNTIRDDIKVVVRVATWLLPVEEAEDELDRERARAEQHRLWTEQDQWGRQERAMTERLEAEAEAAREKAYQEGRVARDKADQEIARQAAKTKAIKKAQLELARQAVKEMESPFDEMLRRTREDMLAKVNRIAGNITKRGFVDGKQVEAIRNLVSLFKVINAAGDEELEDRMAELNNSLSVSGEDTKRDMISVRAALQNVATTCMTQAAAVIETTTVDEFALLDI